LLFFGFEVGVIASNPTSGVTTSDEEPDLGEGFGGHIERSRFKSGSQGSSDVVPLLLC
jgi:hypothetical protein